MLWKISSYKYSFRFLLNMLKCKQPASQAKANNLSKGNNGKHNKQIWSKIPPHPWFGSFLGFTIFCFFTHTHTLTNTVAHSFWKFMCFNGVFKNYNDLSPDNVNMFAPTNNTLPQKTHRPTRVHQHRIITTSAAAKPWMGYRSRCFYRKHKNEKINKQTARHQI